ncbi:MAG: hypothetical protein K0R08_2236 [Solimicrobium sp.]|jgi:hypothetical protein|nr:hypothetical protein [Solimicrobium sp.]
MNQNRTVASFMKAAKFFILPCSIAMLCASSSFADTCPEFNRLKETRTSNDRFIDRLAGNYWEISIWSNVGNDTYLKVPSWSYSQTPASFFSDAKLLKVQVELLKKSYSFYEAKNLECIYRDESRPQYEVRMSLKPTGRLFKHPQYGYEYIYGSITNPSNWFYEAKPPVYTRTCPRAGELISNCTFTLKKNVQTNGYWSDAPYRCGTNTRKECAHPKGQLHQLIDRNGGVCDEVTCQKEIRQVNVVVNDIARIQVGELDPGYRTPWYADPKSDKAQWIKKWNETSLEGQNVTMEGTWLWKEFNNNDEREIANNATNLKGTWPDYSGLGYKKVDRN